MTGERIGLALAFKDGTALASFSSLLSLSKVVLSVLPVTHFLFSAED
jgi:hypothetical protein